MKTLKTLNVTQLAQYLAVTKRSVQRRAITQGWCCKHQYGLGGTRKTFVFEQLPAKTRQQVVEAILAKHQQLGLNYNELDFGLPARPDASKNDDAFYLVSGNPLAQAAQSGDWVNGVQQASVHSPIVPAKRSPGTDDWLAQHKFAHALDTQQLTKLYVKQGLVVMARLCVYDYGQGKIKGFDHFCQRYNQRDLEVNQAIYKVVKKVSRASLLRWEAMLKRKTDQQSEIAPQLLLDPQLQLILQEMMLVSPHISPGRLRQYCQSIFKNRKPLPNQKQLEIWMKQQ